ncbi:MAG: hypothetical protein ACOY42_02015 [Pseudomonadota bacterium]
MSFSLKLVDEYDWPVVVKVPNGGAIEEHGFTARFRHLEIDEVRAMIETVLAASKAAPAEGHDGPGVAMGSLVEAAQIQIEQAMQYLVGWDEDLTDTKGQPLPCTDEIKRALLGVRIIREAVVAAWQQSQSGDAARLGNSVSSPAGGPAAGDR